jgi:hypothetical protein
MILQIPPVDPSTSLRTAFLLRLTTDVLGAIPGYTATQSDLPQLLAWLDELDAGWLAVLRGEAWDPSVNSGVPVEVMPGQTKQKVSQTERARLRSALIGGTDRLEDWLEGVDTTGDSFVLALERMGLKNGFNDLFGKTLAEMGSLAGSAVISDPNGMVGTC